MNDGEIVFEFERGSFFGGNLRYVVEEENGLFIFTGFPSNGLAWMGRCEFVLPEEEISNLYEELIEIENWKRNYKNPDQILDGYGWVIKYTWAEKKIYSHGYEQYPKEYKRIIKKLQTKMEEIMKKYDPDYQEEGMRERLML